MDCNRNFPGLQTIIASQCEAGEELESTKMITPLMNLN